jgi:hypothetical protein
MRLERVGFYDRRARSVAPERAFISAERIENLTTFSDLRRFTGRDVCKNNIYVDGVRILNIPAQGLRSNVLDFLGVESVAGIEMYDGAAEVPVEYGVKQKAGSVARACATVVWTK